MNETIYIANITVKVKERYQIIEKTFKNVSYVDNESDLYKGNKIVKIEKTGVLGKTSKSVNINK